MEEISEIGVDVGHYNASKSHGPLYSKWHCRMLRLDAMLALSINFKR